MSSTAADDVAADAVLGAVEQQLMCRGDDVSVEFDTRGGDDEGGR
jgi:hypothetical protein